MFPRYGRKNRRCKLKHPKERMSYGKKILCQSIVSFCMLAVLVILSLFKTAPNAKMEECLYNTYSLSRWKKEITYLSAKIKSKSLGIGSAYMSLFTGYKETESTPVSEPEQTAKAHKEEIYEPETETENPENNHDNLKVHTSVAIRQWRMPLEGNISSEFGERIHPITGEKTVHNGIDIASDEGEAVFSVSDGVVERTGYDTTNGKYVVVNHGDGITSVYIHLSDVTVAEGSLVTVETQIGKTGSTGMATGPHLHFEIKENGVSTDPKKYISP